MSTTKSALLTIPEAAARLRLSVHTLRQWVSERRIPSVVIGTRRVLLQESTIDALVDAGRRDAWVSQVHAAELRRRARRVKAERKPEGRYSLVECLRLIHRDYYAFRRLVDAGLLRAEKVGREWVIEVEEVHRYLDEIAREEVAACADTTRS